MQNTIDAVKYGIDTLGVSPKEFFALLEVANNYKGTDYKKWLAREIIKIAEKDGVGYSQLLVKKFSIIQSLKSTYSSSTLNRDVCGRFISSLGVAVKDCGLVQECNIDWFNGIDLDSQNCSFTKNNLPEVLQYIEDEKPICVVATLKGTQSNKSCSLYVDAKECGLVCKTEGALVIYRACKMADAFPDADLRFGFLADVDWLVSKDNEGVLSYLCNRFSVSGMSCLGSELYGVYDEGGYVFLSCVPGQCDCIEIEGKSYSRSKKSMSSFLSGMPSSGEHLARISRKGSSIVIGSYDEGIPVSESNLVESAIYYGVCRSLEHFAYSTDIRRVMNGHPLYKELFYNCFVLMLFDDNSTLNCKGVLSLSSPLVQRYLDEGAQYFSFEAKKLLELCKGYYDFCDENGISVSGLSFSDLRKEANHAELNSVYLQDSNNLRDFITSLYKKVE